MSNADYQDIIHLPHHQSADRPHMSLHDRAAQFAPFAALRGYDDEISETARLTDRQLTLNDEQIAAVNRQLNLIAQNIKSAPKARITYFIPDEKKEGGQYKTIEENIRRIDEVQKQIILTNGETIAIPALFSIEMLS
ncbi:MAG: hypothetical protein E7517_07030 [Ruminococcaceae bacterium]|nr:hypothetical protein [Oscillospiraceae bacterium]